MARATNITVTWDHNYQTWTATDDRYPGLAGVSPNKGRARHFLKVAKAEQDEQRKEQKNG